MKGPVKQQDIDVLFWGFFLIFCHTCYLTAQIWYALLQNFEGTFVCVLCICVSSEVCVEGKKTVTWQEWKGEISCLFEKDTCRIHARLAIAMSLLALQMCFLTHNRLQLDLIGHISLLLWTPLHLLFRVIIFTHIWCGNVIDSCFCTAIG